MFVKQVTEQELTEYERLLEGCCNSIQNLTGNDEETGAQVHATLDSCRDLQGLLREQIAGFHPAVKDPPQTVE